MQIGSYVCPNWSSWYTFQLNKFHSDVHFNTKYMGQKTWASNLKCIEINFVVFGQFLAWTQPTFIMNKLHQQT